MVELELRRAACFIQTMERERKCHVREMPVLANFEEYTGFTAKFMGVPKEQRWALHCGKLGRYQQYLISARSKQQPLYKDSC